MTNATNFQIGDEVTFSNGFGVNVITEIKGAYVDYLIKGRTRRFATYTITTPAVFTNVKEHRVNVRSHYLIHFRELEKMR